MTFFSSYFRLLLKLVTTIGLCLNAVQISQIIWQHFCLWQSRNSWTALHLIMTSFRNLVLSVRKACSHQCAIVVIATTIVSVVASVTTLCESINRRLFQRLNMATELTWAFAFLSSLNVHFSFEVVKGTYKRKEENRFPCLSFKVFIFKIPARFIVKTWIFSRLCN